MAPPPEQDGARPAGDLELEELVEQVLDRLPQDGTACIDEVCGQRPRLAERVRALVGRLESLGLTAGMVTGESVASHGNPLDLPHDFGPFRLLRRLGGGGMGVVYLAEEPALRRRVAVKLIRAELLGAPNARARFEREVEAAGRLDHPNLVTVFARGETDGQPWVSMKLVEGQSLEECLQEARQQSTRTPGTRRRSRSTPRTRRSTIGPTSMRSA